MSGLQSWGGLGLRGHLGEGAAGLIWARLPTRRPTQRGFVPQKELKELRMPRAGGSKGCAASWSPSCSHCTQAASLAPLRIPGRMKRLTLSPLLYQAPFSTKKKKMLYFKAWDVVASREKNVQYLNFGPNLTMGRAGGRDGAPVPVAGGTPIAGQRGPSVSNVTPAWPIPIPTSLPGAPLGLWIKFSYY